MATFARSASLVLLFLGLFLAGDANAATANAKIDVQNTATSDGVINFEFTPVGGATQAIDVTVKKGMTEVQIAKEIEKEFKSKLGTKNYSINQMLASVIIRKKPGKANFDLKKTGLTVQGTIVNVQYLP